MAKKKGLTLKAAAGGAAELHIDGPIGGYDGVTAKDIRQQLKEVGEVSEVKFFLSSPGGYIVEGLNIYNTIKRLKARTKIFITGLAASMGSVIAEAGDEVYMAEGSLYMIHNPWGGALGEAKDLRKAADVLDKMKNILVDVYVGKTSKEAEDVSQLMDDETWMDAKEAMAHGFIDGIEGEIDAENIVTMDQAKDMVNKAMEGPESEFKSMLAMASPILNQDNNGMFSVLNAVKTTPKKDEDNQQIFVFEGKGYTDELAEAIAKHISEIGIIVPQGSANCNHLNPEGRNPRNQPQEESNVDETLEELQAALQARNDAIIKLFAKHTQLSELKAECLADSKMTLDEVKNKMLDALGASPDNKPVGGVIVIKDARDKFTEGAIKAVAARANLEKDDSQNELRGYSLKELARKSLEVNGVKAYGDQMVFVGSAFTHSSGDFGNILSNVANKAMLKGFDESPEVFDKFTATGTLTDFKETTRTDIGPAPSLREVKEGAEFKHVTLGDKGVTAMLATYGELFSITRQAIINDDLSAFTRIPGKFGRAARRTVGDLVFSQIINATYSTAAGGNAIASAAFSATNLEALRVKMATAKDGKVTTGVRPSFLLTPEGLGGTARQEIAREFIDSAKTPNPVRGLVEPISDYRLDDDSATKYYLLADPNRYDALEVLYLDGNANPFLDQQTGWGIDGAKFKVRIDAAAKLWDERSISRVNA